MIHIKSIQLSVIVPLYNEFENAPLLYQAIKEALAYLNNAYEIIFVDDGSQDGTRDVIRSIAEKDPVVKAIIFRKNFGQSAAMAAGFRASKGDIVITLDGDLQNDPTDIPLLLEKINEGYDVVSGWRKNRQDKLFIRKIPSGIANRLICSITDVQLHDTGCALKAYRKEVVQGIRLYGELHRFLPALARVEGARITEIVVNHHARRFGESKYNLTRTFRVVMDLCSLNLFLKYLKNPMRFFGGIGMFICFTAVLASIWMGLKLFNSVWQTPEINVFVTLLFLLWALGFQFVTMGMIASLVIKTADHKGQTLAVDKILR